ncbi:MAG TPA: DUF5060 domain-containing protein, partial [Candidatus Glassbacteria bacterium]|nr:DUF5060 domain-containing protein [Candidatus Glassbacteria bacterium]
MTAESHFRTLRVIIALLILSAAGRAAALPRIVKAVPEKSVVGRWEKFELRVSLSADFFNPYDPEQVDLKAEFTSPSGRKWLINGFFNPVQWDLHWMVRFAPDEAGPWRFDLRVKDSGGRSPVYSGTFEVT